MATRSPVKVALLGAGGFVKDAWLPALAASTQHVLLVACWSRSADSVWALLPEVQK